MKPGDKFLMLFELDRPVQTGDAIHGTPYKGKNLGNHLWWAKPANSDPSNLNPFKIVICLDDNLTSELPPVPTGLSGLNFKT